MKRCSIVFKAQTAFLSVSRCDSLASTHEKKTSWKRRSRTFQEMFHVTQELLVGGGVGVGVQVRLRGESSAINNDPSHVRNCSSSSVNAMHRLKYFNGCRCPSCANYCGQSIMAERGFFVFKTRVRGVKTDHFLPLEQLLVTKTQP